MTFSFLFMSAHLIYLDFFRLAGIKLCFNRNWVYLKQDNRFFFYNNFWWVKHKLYRPATPSGCSKKKNEKQRKRKGCHQGQNVTVLAILERLEFKNFSCRPTMVADNTFQCSMTPPLWNPFRRLYLTVDSLFTVKFIVWRIEKEISHRD